MEVQLPACAKSRPVNYSVVLRFFDIFLMYSRFLFSLFAGSCWPELLPKLLTMAYPSRFARKHTRPALPWWRLSEASFSVDWRLRSIT